MKKDLETAPEKGRDLLYQYWMETKENKEKIIDDCFPDDSEERDEFEVFFHNYLRELERIIEKAGPGAEVEEGFPLVVIGSEVEVEDLPGGDIFKFRIVTPYNCEAGIEDVSCLSPTGKALVLKKPGEEVSVKAPAGDFRYRIRKISYPP